MQPNEAAIEGKSHRKTAEPRPDLLPNNLEVSVNRIKSAQILGITTRTLDRWVADGTLTPIGSGSRKRLKAKDLKRLLDKKQLDRRDKT